ncbi:hypothetical protein [Streptomyces sp. NPDC016845]|uniref:hypothetical protein n=1 Tax=Streptomyces sp. NPDC016845 TaxID=3364972 RepID=UPI00379E3822
MRPPLFVLVHSSSVGPATWHPVAEHLTAGGHQVCVPSLLHIGAGGPPIWPPVVAAVREELRRIPVSTPLTLVAHSNAGLFLPLIRWALDQPVTSSVFVDAAERARERGWRVAHLPGAHLHQIVDPAGTARHLVELGAPV